jgi:anti-sigma factor RsiW
MQDAQQHVRQCPQCEARLAEMRMIGDIVRNAPLPQPAKAAMARWHRNLAAIEERQVRRLASWMTAAASIVLAVSLYSAMSHQAVAASTPQLAEWEATLIGLDTSGPAEQTTAQWMSSDLSRQQQRRGTN